MFEAYVAGFLDADGSVSLLKDRKDMGEYQRSPKVEFYNCDKGILLKIQNRWGGTFKTKKGAIYEKNPHWNTSYTLILYSDKAVNLLSDVVEYMHHEKKKERAKLIVDNYKRLTPRNGKYTPELMVEKVAFVEKVMSIKMRGEGAY